LDLNFFVGDVTIGVPEEAIVVSFLVPNPKRQFFVSFF